MAEFIAEKNRARKNPLTISLLQKTFLSYFLASPPLDIEFEGPEDKRQQEKENLVRFMSLIADETLVGRWNPDANNASHKLAERIYFSGAVRAWVPMLRDVAAQIFGLYDETERTRVFFREVSDEQMETIRQRIRRMVEHKLWLDPDPDVDSSLRVNNESIVRKFFTDRGLTVNWILGGKGA